MKNRSFCENSFFFFGGVGSGEGVGSGLGWVGGSGLM